MIFLLKISFQDVLYVEEKSQLVVADENWIFVSETAGFECLVVSSFHVFSLIHRSRGCFPRQLDIRVGGIQIATFFGFWAMV